MEGIVKHINDTNASFRTIGAGNAKNTDLFLDNEHYEYFRDAGEQITVRLNKENLQKAILFIASILPRKYDNSGIHKTEQFSTEFVFDQLAILDAFFTIDGVKVDARTQKWNARKDVVKKNGDIDNRFYFNGLLEDVPYINSKGEQKTAKFTIRNYFAGGYSEIHIKKSDDGIFDVWVTNTCEFKEDGKELPYEELQNYPPDHPLQQIFYGAPGTGKSHRIKEIIQEHGIDEKEQVIRTTFHPDSDYSTFVGCYKPIMKSVPQTYVVEGKEKPVIDIATNQQSQKDEIVYDYTPQAFIQAYTKAWTNPDKPIILVIEEINRGNCAQIFGDIFQLLDRGNDGVSEYKIKPDKALEDYLKGYFEGYPDVEIRDEIRTGESMKLPANLYIWATMNTSDQSLFPIDSAFKRRWEWKYLPINNHEDKNYKIEIGSTKYDWWGFLSKINEVIGNTTSSEDKKLGYFFAKANAKGIVTAEQFVGKVLFYLWNDVFKNYGFDNQIFDKGDKKKFDFSDFFKQDGNPDTDMVNMFLGKLDETIDKENSIVEKAKDENGQGE